MCAGDSSKELFCICINKLAMIMMYGLEINNCSNIQKFLKHLNLNLCQVKEFIVLLIKNGHLDHSVSNSIGHTEKIYAVTTIIRN